MKKTVPIFSLAVFLIVLTSGIVASQAKEKDFTGTWVGSTEVPNAPEPDKLTLVIEKEEGEYVGTITDSMGMLQEAELEDIEIEDNTFSCIFSVFTGSEYLQVSMTLTLEGDKMTGSWEAEDGSTGPVELERSK